METQMNILIFGAGSHGKVVHAIMRRMGIQDSQIYYVDLFKVRFQEFNGSKVLGSLQEGYSLPKQPFKAILSYAGEPFTGNLERNKLTSEIVNSIAANDDEQFKGFLTVIDPSSIVSMNVKIGVNVSIGMNCILNIDSEVGDGVIINNNCLIEHDVRIGNFCNISPSSTLLGNVKLKNNVFVGAGSILRNNITIGENSVIAFGSNVVKNVPPDSLYIKDEIIELSKYKKR